jgi:hypothetical protein
VVDEGLLPVAAADRFLRDERFGRDRAELAPSGYASRWPDGPLFNPAHDLYNPSHPNYDPDDDSGHNYSSRNESEFFAQLVNAYLGTNTGPDPYTGLPRNNSAEWVRAYHPILVPILERIAGPDPKRVYSGQANPVVRAQEENDRWAGFRAVFDPDQQELNAVGATVESAAARAVTDQVSGGAVSSAGWSAPPTSITSPRGPLLSVGEVDAALRYYRHRRELYSDRVIGDLRQRLGFRRSGGLTAELVQSIAEFQAGDEGRRRPQLRVDGIVGPRTASRLFVFGLADAATARAFGDAVQAQVFDRWNSLGTADARAAELVRMANWYLEHAGVPRLGRSAFLSEQSYDNSGFDSNEWIIRFHPRRFEQDQLSADEARVLAEAAYHEARHAEQYFSIAQLLAGQKQRVAGLTRSRHSTASIESTLGIPREIARAARDGQRITPGTVNALVAQGWFDSGYGTGAQHRETVLREGEEAYAAFDDADAAYWEAYTNNQEFPSPDGPELVRLADQRRYEADQWRYRNQDQYHHLPEENDGRAVGALIRAADIRGTAAPAAASWTAAPGQGSAGVSSGDQVYEEYSYDDGYDDLPVGAPGPSSGMTALTQAYGNMNLNTASGGGFASTAASAAGPSSSGFDGSPDQARYFPASSAATGDTSGPGYVIIPERTEYPPEYQQD